MEFLKIVVFCVLAAIGYGILHDQITAHLCVEYFTIGHPPVFPTQSPFWLAIGWGIIATWWVGLPLGVLLAAAARWGSRAKRSLSDVRPLIVGLLMLMAVCAGIAGLVGAKLAVAGVIALPGSLARAIPTDRHVAFLADWWAHSASYLVGAVGGLVVIFYVGVRRLAFKDA